MPGLANRLNRKGDTVENPAGLPEFPDTFWSFKHALKFVRKKAGAPLGPADRGSHAAGRVGKAAG